MKKLAMLMALCLPAVGLAQDKATAFPANVTEIKSEKGKKVHGSQ